MCSMIFAASVFANTQSSSKMNKLVNTLTLYIILTQKCSFKKAVPKTYMMLSSFYNFLSTAEPKPTKKSLYNILIR